MPRLTDGSDIRARLERDRHWSAFSLADLDLPYATHAHWFGPPDSPALVLVYDAFDPPIVFSQGQASECERLLAESEVRAKTPRAWLNVVPEHLPMVRRLFSTFDSRRMVRMVLEHSSFSPLARADVVRLDPADLDDLLTLYMDDPPAFFLPSQLRDGIYYGVRDLHGLMSVAGTHVVSTATGVGALGNVYTRPDSRGQGMAAAVTSAVVRELLDRGTQTIVLNIVATNSVARRVYERIGFREYCVYYEGLATR